METKHKDVITKIVPLFTPIRKRDISISNNCNETTPAGKKNIFNRLESTDELINSTLEKTQQRKLWKTWISPTKRMQLDLNDSGSDWSIDILLKVNEIQKQQQEN